MEQEAFISNCKRNKIVREKIFISQIFVIIWKYYLTIYEISVIINTILIIFNIFYHILLLSWNYYIHRSYDHICNNFIFCNPYNYVQFHDIMIKLVFFLMNKFSKFLKLFWYKKFNTFLMSFFYTFTNRYTFWFTR